jgi:protein BCP1
VEIGNGGEENTNSDSSSDSEEIDIVNVDFEMFDPQPDHDFHGLKTLLRQLFDADNTLFDLSALTDLILSQPLLGTTVKVDGNESDPYAFLTVVNLQEHKDKPVVQDLIKYILARSQSSPNLNKKLNELLSSSASSHTGLILTERLINVPTEIVPPMYKMLLEEINWAIEENEPYNFSNFLIISKTYTEIPSKIDALESRPQKKGKKGSSKSKNELFYFHPEDETIQRSGEHASYKYVKEGGTGTADSKRAFSDFGIMPQGHIILVGKDELPKIVEGLEKLFSPGA